MRNDTIEYAFCCCLGVTFRGIDGKIKPITTNSYENLIDFLLGRLYQDNKQL